MQASEERLRLRLISLETLRWPTVKMSWVGTGAV